MLSHAQNSFFNIVVVAGVVKAILVVAVVVTFGAHFGLCGNRRP